MSNLDRKFRRQGINKVSLPAVTGLPEGMAPGVLMGTAIVATKVWEVIMHPSTKEYSLRPQDNPDGVLTFSEGEVAGIAFAHGTKIEDPTKVAPVADEMVDVVIKGALYRLTRQVFATTVAMMLAKATEADVTETTAPATPPVTGEAATIIPPEEKPT